MTSIIPLLKETQKKHWVVPRRPQKKDRVGFVFSTKERVDFTKQTLPSMDQDGGYDIVWVDGSDSEEARKLPASYNFRNAGLAEYHLDIKGGPNKAIRFGLGRLIELGYNYCGLMENDILLKKGWFEKLMGLFILAADDGIAVGAATVRNFESRVLEYRNRYTINWNIGAGMILFSRDAAKLLTENYPPIATAQGLYKFYGKHLGLDLGTAKELWFDKPDRAMSPDFNYETVLYPRGLAAIGSVPAYAIKELEAGVSPEERGTKYVSEEKRNFLVYKPMNRWKLPIIYIIAPFFSATWVLFKNMPWLKKLARRVFDK